jgi:hypothetical protein
MVMPSKNQVRAVDDEVDLLTVGDAASRLAMLIEEDARELQGAAQNLTHLMTTAFDKFVHLPSGLHLLQFPRVDEHASAGSSSGPSAGPWIEESVRPSMGPSADPWIEDNDPFMAMTTLTTTESIEPSIAPLAEAAAETYGGVGTLEHALATALGGGWHGAKKLGQLPVSGVKQVGRLMPHDHQGETPSTRPLIEHSLEESQVGYDAGFKHGFEAGLDEQTGIASESQ